MKHQEPAAHTTREVATRRTALPSAAKPRRAPAAKKVSTVNVVPIIGRDDMIRRQAYSLYEARNCEPGHALEDWLQAQAQVDGHPLSSVSSTGEAAH